MCAALAAATTSSVADQSNEAALDGWMSSQSASTRTHRRPMLAIAVMAEVTWAGVSPRRAGTLMPN